MGTEFKELITEVVKHLKEFINSQLINIDIIVGQVDIIEWHGLKAVRKKFSSEIGILKWLPPSLFYKASYPFTISPYERFRRELTFFSRGGGRWYRVPKVYEVNERELTLVREFIDGNFLGYNVEHAELFARALAEIHSSGYVLGDVKPTNFVVGDGLWVIDAEQSTVAGGSELMGWDLILTLLFASYSFFTDVSEFRRYVRVFLKSYVSYGGSLGAVKSILSIKNLSIALLIPPHHLVSLADTVDDVVREF